MAEAETYKALAKRLSTALLKVRPLGGSELFIKVGDEYYADPEYCGAAIEKMKADLLDVNMSLAKATKRFK